MMVILTNRSKTDRGLVLGIDDSTWAEEGKVFGNDGPNVSVNTETGGLCLAPCLVPGGGSQTFESNLIIFEEECELVIKIGNIVYPYVFDRWSISYFFDYGNPSGIYIDQQSLNEGNGVDPHTLQVKYVQRVPEGSEVISPLEVTLYVVNPSGEITVLDEEGKATVVTDDMKCTFSTSLWPRFKPNLHVGDGVTYSSPFIANEETSWVEPIKLLINDDYPTLCNDFDEMVEYLEYNQNGLTVKKVSLNNGNDEGFCFLTSVDKPQIIEIEFPSGAFTEDPLLKWNMSQYNPAVGGTAVILAPAPLVPRIHQPYAPIFTSLNDRYLVEEGTLPLYQINQKYEFKPLTEIKAEMENYEFPFTIKTLEYENVSELELSVYIPPADHWEVVSNSTGTAPFLSVAQEGDRLELKMLDHKFIKGYQSDITKQTELEHPICIPIRISGGKENIYDFLNAENRKLFFSVLTPFEGGDKEIDVIEITGAVLAIGGKLVSLDDAGGVGKVQAYYNPDINGLSLNIYLTKLPPLDPDAIGYQNLTVKLDMRSHSGDVEIPFNFTDANKEILINIPFTGTNE